MDSGIVVGLLLQHAPHEWRAAAATPGLDPLYQKQIAILADAAAAVGATLTQYPAPRTAP